MKNYTLKRKLLNREQEREYLERIAKGDSEAREEFLSLNLRLVYSIARKFSRNGDFEDLVSAGKRGLFVALNQYNISKGTRFGTYAFEKIKKEIRDSFKEGKPIYYPSNKVDLKNKMYRFEQKFYAINGVKPTDDEVFGTLLTLDPNLKTPSKVISYLRQERTIFSLDQQIHDSDVDSFHDIIPDKEENDLKKEIRILISELSENQRRIIQGIYFEGRTMKQIAEDLGCTKSNVSRVHKIVLKKLKLKMSNYF